jgi:dTMP kinase
MIGLFVTFEGLDGSGKSTQLVLCAEALRKAGHEVLETRNPGGTPLGQEIRQMLLHHPGSVSPTCELLLYMADRAQHMGEVVLPALKANRIVLCDRYIDSTVAYQGYGRGLDRAFIQGLNEVVTHYQKPHITFLFDAPPEALATRVSQRGAADRLEQEAIEFREKVREGFLALAQAEPQRIVVCDAMAPVDILHQKVMDRLESILAQTCPS